MMPQENRGCRSPRVGVPLWGSWSWGAGGLASPGRPGTRPVPRGSTSVQIVSVLFVRVSSLRARGLEGEGCACVAEGCDGIRGWTSRRGGVVWRRVSCVRVRCAQCCGGCGGVVQVWPGCDRSLRRATRGLSWGCRGGVLRYRGAGFGSQACRIGELVSPM